MEASATHGHPLNPRKAVKLLLDETHVGRWNATAGYGKPNQRYPLAINQIEPRVFRPRVLDESNRRAKPFAMKYVACFDELRAN